MTRACSRSTACQFWLGCSCSSALGVACWVAPGVAAPASRGGRLTADEPQYVLTAISLGEDFDLDISDERADEPLPRRSTRRTCRCRSSRGPTGTP